MVVSALSRPAKTRLNLARKLAAYSTAAAASTLLADQVAAEVVPFVPPGGPQTIANPNGGFHDDRDFDLDGDGTADFRITAYLSFFLTTPGFDNDLSIQLAPHPILSYVAANVPAGETIGPAFTEGAYDFTNFEYHIGTRGFVGLKFLVPALDQDVDGASPGYHFAFLDVAIDSDENSLTLYGGAYESEPDTPIVTQQVPEPSTLALLATGAAGLFAWRRRRSEWPKPA